MILTDFNNFNQLNFDCENPINMTILTIHPSKKIILDDSLKFNQIKIRNRLFNIYNWIFSIKFHV